MTRRARVLFVQPSLNPPGGGNGVASWMLQTLLGDYDVEVLTWRPIDYARIRHFYGTSFAAGDFVHHRVAPVRRTLVSSFVTELALLRWSLLTRAARAMAPRFDITVTANNEAEFGIPGIQYVHYPIYKRPRPTDDVRWYHTDWALDIYYAYSDRLAEFSLERMRACRTLVNSDWTGRIVTKLHGIPTETLFPPIATDVPQPAWSDREPAFLCVGRLAPHKRLETSLEIVEDVRRTHPAVRLHVVGNNEPGRYCQRLIARLRSIDWVTLHLDISRPALQQLIGRCRFGLHPMHDEHFGMAPAEMLCGGCVVWVHDSGGQVDIVGRDPRVMFTTAAEAATRIRALLDDQPALDRVRAAMAARRELFSIERFQSRFRTVVQEVLASARNRSEPASSSS